jgi:hypothetical protein
MVVSAWLIDKSAISRLHRASDAAEWASRIERGLVRICTVTRLELTVLYVNKDFELIADITGQPVERLDVS